VYHNELVRRAAEVRLQLLRAARGLLARWRRDPVTQRDVKVVANRHTRGFGALERGTNPKLSRRTCNPRYGLQSWRGASAGVAKRARELFPIPNVAIQLCHRCTPCMPPPSLISVLVVLRGESTHRDAARGWTGRAPARWRACRRGRTGTARRSWTGWPGGRRRRRGTHLDWRAAAGEPPARTAASACCPARVERRGQ
jgi:hypothetical protein